MRDARSTRTATALRGLNVVLLVGLGASLAVVAPEIRARLAPTTAKATSTPLPGPLVVPIGRELAIDPPRFGGNPVWQVIENGRAALNSCYRRVLWLDNRLGTGKVTVDVSAAISGRVVAVSFDAPPTLQRIEPCVREVMSRWAFPPAPKPYAFEFGLLLY